MSAGDEPPATDAVVWFLCVSLLLGVATNAVLRALPPQWWHPPYTVWMFFVGVIMSAMRDSLGTLGTEMVEAAENVHPHVILYGLLPPLIFESASSLDWHVFKRTAPQALILAFPGVIVAAFATAGLAMACFTEYDWSLDTALILGSIVSATDPVAVVAALHELGAPKRLSSVIEGESLFNDGSAFVLFLVVLKHISGEGLSAGGVVEFFFQLALGGPAFGLAMGLLVGLAFVLARLSPTAEITLSTAMVFATFLLAERQLEVSGVLATVTLGLFMSARGQFLYTPGVERDARSFLGVLSEWSNTAIFVLAGVISYDSGVRNEAVANDGTTWGYAFLLYLLLHVVRAAVVGLFWPVLRRLGYGLSWKEGVIMVFGGLRGAVALALVLLLREEKENLGDGLTDLHRIELLVSMVVVLTLVVNGTLVNSLYAWLQVYPKSHYRAVTFARSMAELEGETKAEVRAVLGRDFLFGHADWMCVDELVPDLSQCRVRHGHIVVPPQLLRHRYVPVFQHFFEMVDSGKAPEVAARLERSASAPMSGERMPRRVGSVLDTHETAGNVVRVVATAGDAQPPPVHRRATVPSRPSAGSREAAAASHAAADVELDLLDQPAPYEDGVPANTAATDAEEKAGGDGDGDGDGDGGGGGDGDGSGDDSGGDSGPDPVARRRLSRQDSINSLADGVVHTLPDLHRVLTRDATFVRAIDSGVSPEDRAREVVSTLVNMLHAEFLTQFDRGQCSDDALLLLDEAVSDAYDVFRGRKSAREFQQGERPVLQRLAQSVWERLLASLEPERLPCLRPQNPVQQWSDYTQVFLRIETLSAYARAVASVAELAQAMFPQNSVRKSLCKYLDAAKAECLAETERHPRWSLIATTVLTARAFTHLKQKRLEEMAEEGVIPHGELEKLNSILDRSMVALSYSRLAYGLSRLAEKQA